MVVILVELGTVMTSFLKVHLAIAPGEKSRDSIHATDTQRADRQLVPRITGNRGSMSRVFQQERE